MRQLLPFIVVFIVISCSKEIPSEKLVERNGLSYEINTETPYTGVTLSYHTNGQLSSRVRYKNGLKDGSSEIYNQNGQIIDLRNYKENIEEGPYELFHENGQISVRGVMENGKPIDGPLRFYFDNGSLETINTYKGGQIDGPYEDYYRTGEIKTRLSVKNGKPDGLQEKFYKNGNEESVYFVTDGVFNGSYKSYWENGNLKKEVNYLDGKESFEIKTYFENGQLQKNNFLERGRKFFTEYHDNGQLSFKESLKNDVNDGLSVKYFKNGMTLSWYNYKEGKQIGNGGKFFSDGEPSVIYGRDRNGEDHGWTLFISETGNVRKSCYENGDMKLIGSSDPLKCDGLTVNQSIERFKQLTSEYF